MAAFVFASIASAAARVVSLDLCADEYLLLLARPAQVAGVSRLSHDPAESPLWRSARTHAAHNGRIEALLPLKPTLLVAVGGVGGRSTLPIAQKLGIRVLTLPYPQSPAEVVGNVRRLATALGEPRRAAPIASAFARLQRTRPALRDTVYLSQGGLSVAADGLSARWMRLAGFRQRPLPGGRVTLEQLATRPPAVLLRSDYRSGQLSVGQRWLDHPLVRRNPARRIDTDGRRWTCGGPSMIEEIERLRRLG